MKYNNFDDWFNSKDFTVAPFVKESMRDAWNAALDSVEIAINADTTKADIIEKQEVVAAAINIDCTCDKKQIAQGYRCGCGRGETIKAAVIDLSKYLKGLK